MKNFTFLVLKIYSQKMLISERFETIFSAKEDLIKSLPIKKTQTA